MIMLGLATITVHLLQVQYFKFLVAWFYAYHNLCNPISVNILLVYSAYISYDMLDVCFHYRYQTLGCFGFTVYSKFKGVYRVTRFALLILERTKSQIKNERVWRPLLADLLQHFTRGLPGDSLQLEKTNREPLTQQALQSAIEVLKMKLKLLLKVLQHAAFWGS